MMPGGIDPNVKVPAAVLAAASYSDMLHKSAYQTVVEGDAPAEGQTDPAQLTLQPDPAATPQVTDPAPTPQVTDPAPEPDDNDQSWRQRYQTTHGRLEKANQNIRQLSEQVSNMQATLAALNSTPAQQPPELQARSLLTQQEIDEYGPEFLEVVGKKASEIAQRELGGYKSEIENLKRQLAGVNNTVTAQTREKMVASLSERIPNWEELNTNRDFLNWLALPDPFSGVIRHDMLTAAWERNETPRVLAFFNGFLSEEAAVAPQAQTATAPSQGKVPLETFAAPGRAKTAAASPGPAEKPVITRDFITKFYADATANKYRGREAEYQRIEKQIAEAVKEGRIR
jgi:hypothetical protein